MTLRDAHISSNVIKALLWVISLAGATVVNAMTGMMWLAMLYSFSCGMWFATLLIRLLGNRL